MGLLAAECKAGHSCQAAGIRDALMVALRYDKNAGVREKALEGLEPYVAEDVRVRDAVLEALMNDADPRIRTAAINILEPVEADTSVRQVLAFGLQFGPESAYPDRFETGFEPACRRFSKRSHTFRRPHRQERVRSRRKQSREKKR